MPRPYCPNITYKYENLLLFWSPNEQTVGNSYSLHTTRHVGGVLQNSLTSRDVEFHAADRFSDTAQTKNLFFGVKFEKTIKPSI